MYPLDVVKTRMQLTTTEGTTMIGLFSDVVKKEGFVDPCSASSLTPPSRFWNLYRGIPAPIMAEVRCIPRRMLLSYSRAFHLLRPFCV